MTMSQLIENGGAVGIRVRGVLIDIKKGSGLVLRCPDCNRVTQKGMCMVHGKVQGKHDLRIKGVLDDGTGAVTVILGKELTEKLSGKTMEEYNRGKELYLGWAREIIAMGGTVSAEHGIGKLKTAFLQEMYGEEGISQMKALKKIFDPKSLLNKGNLFDID